VTNSRPHRRAHTIWRRRKCESCKSIFTTLENPELAHSLRVTNEKGALQPFQRDYLFLSIYDSLKHRKTAINDATELTETIIKKLLPLTHNASVTRSQVANTATQVLANFDKAAATSYKAFHPPIETPQK
jgi:transcriptional regulator NrdR family protein